MAKRRRRRTYRLSGSVNPLMGFGGGVNPLMGFGSHGLGGFMEWPTWLKVVAVLGGWSLASQLIGSFGSRNVTIAVPATPSSASSPRDATDMRNI